MVINAEPSWDVVNPSSSSRQARKSGYHGDLRSSGGQDVAAGYVWEGQTGIFYPTEVAYRAFPPKIRGVFPI